GGAGLASGLRPVHAGQPPRPWSQTGLSPSAPPVRCLTGSPASGPVQPELVVLMMFLRPAPPPAGGGAQLLLVVLPAARHDVRVGHLRHRLTRCVVSSGALS